VPKHKKQHETKERNGATEKEGTVGVLPKSIENLADGDRRLQPPLLYQPTYAFTFTGFVGGSILSPSSDAGRDEFCLSPQGPMYV
jgi:hypothetical protein